MPVARDGRFRSGRAAPSVAFLGGDERCDTQLCRGQVDGDDARALVSVRSRMRSSGEPAEDQNVAGGDQLGAWIDVADDDDVARVMKGLPSAQRCHVVERARWGIDEPKLGSRQTSIRLGLQPAHARFAALAPLRDVAARAGEVGHKRAGPLRETRLARLEVQPLRERQRRQSIGGSAKRTQLDACGAEQSA